MKHSRLFLTVLALPALLLGSACRKNSNSTAGGCITRNQPKLSDQLLTAADNDTVQRLFSANNIPLKNLQPYQVTNSADSTGGVYTVIQAKQFFNGLPMNTGVPEFRFYKGKRLDSLFLFHGTLTDTDTSGHIGLEQLRKTFLDSKPDTYSFQNRYGNNKNATHWADSCVVAILSYEYKSVQVDGSHSGDTLFKAWAIYPASNLFLPIMVISDQTGEAFPIHYVSLF